MATSPTTIEEITANFSKAKEIRCLKLGTPVGVCHAGPPTYNEQDNSWHSGPVVFWKDGVFATITKTKGAGCTGCGKKKLKK